MRFFFFFLRKFHFSYFLSIFNFHFQFFVNTKTKHKYRPAELRRTRRFVELTNIFTGQNGRKQYQYFLFKQCIQWIKLDRKLQTNRNAKIKSYTNQLIIISRWFHIMKKEASIRPIIKLSRLRKSWPTCLRLFFETEICQKTKRLKLYP